MRPEIPKLRERYRPLKRIKVLFVAESPPESTHAEVRFFYNPNQELRDDLYRTMMKAVFPEYEWRAGEKDAWLRKFQGRGYYLIDWTDESVNRAPNREEILKAALKGTLAEIKTLISPSTPIGLIMENVFEAFNGPLRAAGYSAVHESFLPSPFFGTRRQLRFIESCRNFLRAEKRD